LKALFELTKRLSLFELGS